MNITQLKYGARVVCLGLALVGLSACNGLLAEQQLNSHLSRGREYQDVIGKCQGQENFEADYAPAVYTHKTKIKALKNAVDADAVTDTITDEEDAAFDALAEAADTCKNQLEGDE
ncbi:MAG: hypothetical protein PHS57_02950 [Alphaproteobacteria bacterium]|nr:hypothetical protein [Alphaproteobacteria bacterium]